MGVISINESISRKKRHFLLKGIIFCNIYVYQLCYFDCDFNMGFDTLVHEYTER